MIAYEGVRTPNGARVFRVAGEDREPLRQRIVYHSPTGFEWGYAGSGPADLALNILADVSGWDGSWRFDEGAHSEGYCREHEDWRDAGNAGGCDSAPLDEEGRRASDDCVFGPPMWVFHLHQRFKFEVIANAEWQGFRLEEDVVLQWLASHGVEVASVA